MTEKDQEGPQLVKEFKQCPVCSLRQLINSLIKLFVSYERTISRAETEALKAHLVKLQQELDVSAHPGTDRFGETLAKEVKEKGWMRPAYEFCAYVVQGAVKDPLWENKIPIGSSVPALFAHTEICMNCGAVYAVKLLRGKAVKGAQPVPQPGQKGPLPPGFPPLIIGRG